MLFFSGMFLFVWRVLEACLVYHSFGMLRSYPEFAVGWHYLGEVLVYWGGPVEYFGAFLSQWFCYSWLGALIVTMAAWSFWGLTGSLVALCGGRRTNVLCYLPAVGLLVMYAGYNHPLSLCLAMLTSLLFVVLYEKIPFRGVVVNGVLFVVFAVTVYLIAGGASLFFIILAGACEIVVRRRFYFGLVISVLGVGAVWLVIFFFADIPLQQAYYRLLPFDPEISKDMDRLSSLIIIGTYIFIFSFLLLMGLRQRIVSRKGSGKQRSRHRKRVSEERALLRGRVMWTVESLLLVGVTVAAVMYSYDGNKRQFLRISRFARHEKWEDVLTAAGEMPEGVYNVYINHDINRALYHTGRLGSELFAYRQRLSGLMLMSGMQGQSIVRNLKGCDMFLELGDLNFAEQLAYEVLELKGDNPRVLDRLARINIVKSQTETARVFLNALSMDVIHDDYAERLIGRLEDDPELKGDEAIERLRKCMLTENVAALDYDEESLLLKLLSRNRRNRMAFEYLMAYYLLTGQHDKVVKNIWRFGELGYEKIPRCFEEAIVLSIGMSEKEPNLHGWTISGQTAKRYEAFNSAGRNPMYRGLGKAALKEVLAGDFADSYFLYYLFNLSGMN